MAHVLKAFVGESSTSTGTGAFTLDAALADHRRFSAVCATSDTVEYYIRHATDGTWESGVGTYSAANTLTRTRVVESSNANAAVTFAAGDKEVIIAPLRGDTAATADSVAHRDGSGDLYARWFNGGYVQTTDDSATATVSFIMAKFGDNYHRSASAAKVATFLGGTTLNNMTFTGTIAQNGSVRGNITAMGALNLDCSTSNYFTKSIYGNSTFTFSNVPSGCVYSMTLELYVGSGTTTWPTAVKWPDDATPTFTGGKVHLVTFVTDDGGTRWRGAVNANYVQ